MIKRSTVIAAAAILISLLIHILGLNFTVHIQPEQTAKDATTDVVTLGNSFEDIAETQPEPVAPEETPSPEPEPAAVPEPESADPSREEVLVASPNPQNTRTPDTGTARNARPETTGPSEIDEGRVPEPEIVEPADGNAETTVVAAVTPVAGPDAVSEAPKGDPNARAEPVQATSVEPAPTPPVAPAPQPDASQQIAALPVQPVPETTVIPVIPLERILAEPAPEDQEPPTAPDVVDESELAVVTSPRPPLSTAPSPQDANGLRDGSEDFSELRSPTLIESPLTRYQRDGTDANVQQNARSQSGGLGFLDSRGPGNSDVTNYAGRVLVHLNRAPSVHISARGAAQVFFEIRPDGTVGKIDIVDSIGSSDISRAAKAQILAAAPFPLPPKGITRRLSFTYNGS